MCVWLGVWVCMRVYVCECECVHVWVRMCERVLECMFVLLWDWPTACNRRGIIILIMWHNSSTGGLHYTYPAYIVYHNNTFTSTGVDGYLSCCLVGSYNMIIVYIRHIYDKCAPLSSTSKSAIIIRANSDHDIPHTCSSSPNTINTQTSHVHRAHSPRRWHVIIIHNVPKDHSI
jgi:hypothetical protein